MIILASFLFFATKRLASYLTISILIFSTFTIISFEPAHALADFNFNAVGDWGCNSNTKSTVNNIKGKSPELVLALGDYSYQSTATCWLDIIKDIKSKTKINIGNHENSDSEGYQQYKSAFGLTNPYYSYNYQNVHILTMATDSSFSSSSSQYNFVNYCTPRYLL